MNAPAVEAIDLVKRFGDTVAVDGVSFSVPTGAVLGLLESWRRCRSGHSGGGRRTEVPEWSGRRAVV